MDLNTAIDVIESVAGFTDADTSVGEAWAVVMAQLNAAPAPAGEVADLVAALKVIDKMQQEWVLLGNDDGTASPSLTMPISLRRFTVIRDALTRIADLLEQRKAAPVPVEMIPVEYYDLDSGARIVSEPSEEGPGGCWVVLNSRHVSPLTEFPTAEAAWTALQAAHALPLPGVEVG